MCCRNSSSSWRQVHSTAARQRQQLDALQKLCVSRQPHSSCCNRTSLPAAAGQHWQQLRMQDVSAVTAATTQRHHPLSAPGSTAAGTCIRQQYCIYRMVGGKGVHGVSPWIVTRHQCQQLFFGLRGPPLARQPANCCSTQVTAGCQARGRPHKPKHVAGLQPQLKQLQ